MRRRPALFFYDSPEGTLCRGMMWLLYLRANEDEKNPPQLS